MTIRALIFDVDGTLAETEEAHRRAFNETFADAGMDWTWSVADYTRLLRTTGGKERLRRHRDDLGLARPDEAEIAALHRDKTDRYVGILAGGGLDLRPGVRELVAAGRDAGLRLAVATTTSRPNVEALCAACWRQPAQAVFDVIAAGDEVAAKKPAPDVYCLALERLGLAPDAAIALEDSHNGLVAAKAAGLRAIVSPSTYTAAEDLSAADWQVPDLTRPNLPDELRFAFAA